MTPIEFVAWLMFGAIWVGLVTVAILVILMAFGVTRAVITSKAAAVTRSLAPARHRGAESR